MTDDQPLSILDALVDHPELRVHFESLPPGRYRLDARAPGYAMLEKHFTVLPGTTTDLGTIQLELPGTAAVHVTCQSGAIAWRGSIDVVDVTENLTVGQVGVFDGTGTNNSG